MMIEYILVASALLGCGSAIGVLILTRTDDDHFDSQPHSGDRDK